MARDGAPAALPRWRQYTLLPNDRFATGDPRVTHPAGADPPIPDAVALPGPARRATGGGTSLVVGLLALGVLAALVAIGFQRGQTRRCLAFYGSDIARRVAAAPVVEVWWLEPGSRPGELRARERRDVTNAPGLVHLRRGLVEDANFAWPERPGGAGERLPPGAWDVAIVFSGPDDGRAELVVDLDDTRQTGSLAVVGRPGRIGLGRIAAGLARWLDGVR